MTRRWLPWMGQGAGGGLAPDGAPGARTVAAAPAPRPGSELRQALASCRSGLIVAFLFSAISSVLMLTGAIYMLEVYDRVLPIRSIPTLVALFTVGQRAVGNEVLEFRRNEAVRL
jgi:ABC-type protease/lipase transport system fused ATPase/permease subunit